ncbi:MAG TPA: hypothetical protein VJU54_02820 [Nitrospiraceae bacterium]|nr:hypothetical protein [Nitrospiraceae bacterium]
MATISKILGVLLFGVLWLSNAALASDPASPCENREGQAAMKAGQEQRMGVQMIQGEVLRVEGHTYFVKLQDGKEVNLQVDQTTEKPDINQGDYIEAGMNNQNHALWIRTDKSTDRRNEHAAADCTPN